VPIEVNCTNVGVWPETVMVYKVTPQRFSGAAISNALAIGAFNPSTMRRFTDYAVGWTTNRGIENSTRGLLIDSSLGSMEYSDQAAEDFNPPIKALPTFEEVDRLAMMYLEKIGGDTNQIVFKPGHTDANASRGKPEKMPEPVVCMRGTSYVRQMNGIPFESSFRQGFNIEFGDYSKVNRFKLYWRNFQPYKKYKTLSQQQIIDNIKKGRAVINASTDDPWRNAKKAKKLTLVKISLRYYGEMGNKPQKFSYPYALAVFDTDLEETNKNVLGIPNSGRFILECPILDKEVPFKKQEMK